MTFIHIIEPEEAEGGVFYRAINDTVQVISYFNYINRIACDPGIDPEPES